MRWWPAVVKGQPEINLQKVRCWSADVWDHLQARNHGIPSLRTIIPGSGAVQSAQTQRCQTHLGMTGNLPLFEEERVWQCVEPVGSTLTARGSLLPCCPVPDPHS